MEIAQRVAIIGVTGFVGSGLPPLFAGKGFTTTGISRSSHGKTPEVLDWQRPDALQLANHHAVINLAGEPIDRRWTASAKQRFHESRIGTTRNLVSHLQSLAPEDRPKVLVNASAVGIYGDGGETTLTETHPPGTGYLAELCQAWEDAASSAESLGVRVVRLRIGIVLGRDGAAFRKLVTVFKAGIGGRLGNGQQWMPWIHIDDLRDAIVHCVLSPTLHGAVNGTAPMPERNRDLTRKLAAALHRPALFPVPGFALKLALGGFGGALLDGQRAIPEALSRDGFTFRYPALESALAQLI